MCKSKSINWWHRPRETAASSEASTLDASMSRCALDQPELDSYMTHIETLVGRPHLLQPNLEPLLFRSVADTFAPRGVIVGAGSQGTLDLAGEFRELCQR